MGGTWRDAFVGPVLVSSILLQLVGAAVYTFSFTFATARPAQNRSLHTLVSPKSGHSLRRISICHLHLAAALRAVAVARGSSVLPTGGAIQSQPRIHIER